MNNTEFGKEERGGSALGEIPGRIPAPAGSQGPGLPASELPPSGRGVFRHPLLIILLIFGGAVGVLVLLSFLARSPGSTAGNGGLSFGERVGVVKIEGILTDAEKVVKELHRFQEDKSVKAVVIRVDSPGGLVAPAQEIYAEVKKLAQEKPVVVSMGAVAASGGYYVACPAQVVYANPGTITGSIGVVMELANLEDLFAWMKIKNVVIKSGKFKDMGSSLREMTPEEREILQAFVDNVHAQFEKAVVEGRKLDPEQVHEIANGVIYTGEQAQQLGLVDELGTLWDAIDRAAKLAGIEGKPKVIWPREPPAQLFDFFSSLASRLAGAKERLSSPVRLLYIIQVGGN